MQYQSHQESGPLVPFVLHNTSENALDVLVSTQPVCHLDLWFKESWPAQFEVL